MKGKATYEPIYDITKTFEENLKRGPNKHYKATIKAPAKQGSYELFGFKVHSPFGASACPTGTDSNFIKATFDAGYDIVTTKTRRSVHFEPHPAPNVVHIVPGKINKTQHFKETADRKTADSSDYSTLTLANSFGNNSLDPKYWVPDALKANQAVPKGKLLITNVVGTIQEGFTTHDYYHDFVRVALLAKDAGAKVIEINLSCPNVANEGMLCYDKVAMQIVCELVKQAVGDTPVIAKVGYFPGSEQALFEDVFGPIAETVDGISAINTFAAPIYNPDGQPALTGKDRLRAGLSGHAIKDLGLDMTRRLHDFRERHEFSFRIIGIGGVLTPDDFHDYRQAGADIVLSATGAMYNPNLANQIKQSL